MFLFLVRINFSTLYVASIEVFLLSVSEDFFFVFDDKSTKGQRKRGKASVRKREWRSECCAEEISKMTIGIEWRFVINSASDGRADLVQRSSHVTHRADSANSSQLTRLQVVTWKINCFRRISLTIFEWWWAFDCSVEAPTRKRSDEVKG